MVDSGNTSGSCHSNGQGSARDYGSSSDCTAHAYYWYGGDCHSSAPSANDFNNQSGCTGAGFYWHGGSCHGSQQPNPPPPNNQHTAGSRCYINGGNQGPRGTWQWITDWQSSNGGHWDASWVCQ
jgi:hypothetical protein